MKSVFLVILAVVLVAANGSALNPMKSLTSEALPQLSSCGLSCSYSYIDSNFNEYMWDFSPLCAGSDYSTTDSTGHTYNFQFCGLSAQRCLPSWTNEYQYGVAVQSWGEPPACNASAPDCYDPSTQQKVCCTANCQVLGVGVPYFQLLTSNPKDGVQFTYVGVPPSGDDPFWCPWNEATGAMYPRTITFQMFCDDTVPSVVIVGAAENATSPCSYTITARSAHACPATGPNASPSVAPSPSPAPGNLVLYKAFSTMDCSGSTSFVGQGSSCANFSFGLSLEASCAGSVASYSIYTGQSCGDAAYVTGSRANASSPFCVSTSFGSVQLACAVSPSFSASPSPSSSPSPSPSPAVDTIQLYQGGCTGTPPVTLAMPICIPLNSTASMFAYCSNGYSVVVSRFEGMTCFDSTGSSTLSTNECVALGDGRSFIAQCSPFASSLRGAVPVGA